MTRCVLLLAVGLWPLAAVADEVHLRGGGRLLGNVIEETPVKVTVEIGAGQVSFPASRVERVIRSRSLLDAFQERASRLSPDNRAGWLELAVWARDCGLATQARRAFERVLELDPTNAMAQQALGNVLVGDRWVSSDEAYRLRGYVLFEGAWVTPAERDERLMEQRARIEIERLRAEADARVAEAEARAAEASAEAASAEAARAMEAGPAIGYGTPYGRHHHGHRRGHVRGDDHGRAPERVGPAPSPTPQRGSGTRSSPKPQPPQPARRAPAAKVPPAAAHSLDRSLDR